MITPIYASILGLMLIWLSVHVIKGRRKFGTGLGDAGNIEMSLRIRAQGNFAEYTPFFIILIGYSEHLGLVNWAIHLVGIAFIAGRIMHAYSLLKDEKYVDGKIKNNPVWRIAGMLSTFITITTLAVANLILVAM